jgi:hypothetical protein
MPNKSSVSIGQMGPVNHLPVVVHENGRLPFTDGHFQHTAQPIVLCPLTQIVWGTSPWHLGLKTLKPILGLISFKNQ